jgi:uncharacterized protein YkwD
VRNFPTGHNVSGAFLSFFDRYGGVRVFGYPISDVVNENGRAVQYFERQRFEYHGEAAGTMHEVQLSRLGVDLAPAAALQTSSPPFASNSRSIFVAETRHSLSHSFLDFWKASGEVRVLGYPVSEPVMENGFIVQYFERARMEYHPEKAQNGYGVELGLLGKQYLEAHPDIAGRVLKGESATSQRTIAHTPAGLSAKENTLLEQINNARRAAGAAPVTLDGTLRNIALSRSQDMVARNYFAHTTPDGKDFMTILRGSNVSFKYAGEILANNNSSDADAAAQAFTSFANSGPHNSIMLDGRYNFAGIGEVTNGQGFHYFTVIFVQR